MNQNFSSAIEKLTEGLQEIGKGIETLVSDVASQVFTEKEGGTRIRIKKGSVVLIEKGVYAKLTQDVEAELTGAQEEKTEKA